MMVTIKIYIYIKSDINKIRISAITQILMKEKMKKNIKPDLIFKTINASWMQLKIIWIERNTLKNNNNNKKN